MERRGYTISNTLVAIATLLSGFAASAYNLLVEAVLRLYEADSDGLMSLTGLMGWQVGNSIQMELKAKRSISRCISPTKLPYPRLIWSINIALIARFEMLVQGGLGKFFCSRKLSQRQINFFKSMCHKLQGFVMLFLVLNTIKRHVINARMALISVTGSLERFMSRA